MDIVVTTVSSVNAAHVKEEIIRNFSGQAPDAKWGYFRFSEFEEAIVYKADDNRISDLKDCLLFSMEQADDKLMFAPARMHGLAATDFLICCTHVGQLVTMLLSCFYKDLKSLEIINV